MYQSTQEIENRVMVRMSEFRQAERDVVRRLGMAFDGSSAEEIYRSALEHCGVPRSDTSALNVFSLRALLKHRPMPGSQAWRDSPMAFDGKPGEKSVLDDILA